MQTGTLGSMDVAGLIRMARRDAGLSQQALAETAGIGQSAVSRYERGLQLPSIPTLRALLAAAGKQLKAELEPLDADVKRAIDEISEQPIDDREAVRMCNLIDNLTAVAHRVEGLSAAAILGAPVPAPTLELALAEQSATFDWLADLLDSWSVRILAPAWSVPRVVHLPPNELRELLTAECPGGTFDLVVIYQTARVRLRPPEVVADHVPVVTSGGTICVQPLHQIEATDPQTARVLAVMRGDRPAADSAAPGTTLVRPPKRPQRYDPLEDRWY